MFGSRKKEQYVKLTMQEIQQLEKNMSKRELKEFKKRQKKAKGDLMWDVLMAAEFLDEDLFE
jgi:3-dehydroquinate dehydratase